MSALNPYAPPRGEVRDAEAEGLEPAFRLRNFLNWLLSVISLYVLVDLSFIFGERRQCIHDLIADTIVVRA